MQFQDIVVGNKPFVESHKPNEIVKLLLDDGELEALQVRETLRHYSTSDIFSSSPRADISAAAGGCAGTGSSSIANVVTESAGKIDSIDWETSC
jgi:hypothetical protein